MKRFIGSLAGAVSLGLQASLAAAEIEGRRPAMRGIVGNTTCSAPPARPVLKTRQVRRQEQRLARKGRKV